MSMMLAETLKKLRIEKGYSQREMAELVYVTRSTVARWENGSRLPDPVMISRLSKCLGVETGMLLSIAAESDEAPNVIMVDDNNRCFLQHRVYHCGEYEDTTNASKLQLSDLSHVCSSPLYYRLGEYMDALVQKVIS